MAADPLDDALLRVRKYLVDLERHLDRAEVDHDLTQVGRAWVRAAQVESLLRSVLPPGSTQGLADQTAASPTPPPADASP